MLKSLNYTRNSDKSQSIPDHPGPTVVRPHPHSPCSHTPKPSGAGFKEALPNLGTEADVQASEMLRPPACHTGTNAAFVQCWLVRKGRVPTNPRDSVHMSRPRLPPPAATGTARRRDSSGL